MRLVGGLLFVVLIAGGLLAATQFGAAPQDARFTVLFIATDPTVEKINRGLDRLLLSNPDLGRRFNVVVRAPSNTLRDSELPQHNVLFVELMDTQWVASQADRIETSEAGLRLGIQESSYRGSSDEFARLRLRTDEIVDAYWANSAPGEVANMFQFIAHRYLGEKNILPDPPRPVLAHGVVEIERDGNIRFHAEFPNAMIDSDRPRVAILEYAARARAESLGLASAIANAVRERHLEPVIVFAERAVPAVNTLLRDADGAPRVDAVISLHHKFHEEENADTLRALGVPVLNAIRVFGRTVDEWRQSKQGLSSSEVAWQIAAPELAGLSPPNVVGAIDNKNSSVATTAIPERIARIADRAAKLVALRARARADRHVAVLYWNYPPGKQNIGASYLNVVRSIPQMLRRLAKEGYALGNLDTQTDEELERRIRTNGLNIGRFAPGDLDRLIARGDIVSLPVETYQRWFDTFPKTFRETVLAHWGPPTASTIMTRRVAGELHFVIPALRFGHVVVMPQPDRARMQDLEALYQSQELPPHHQYIAAYLWLQRQFNADVVVHTGTHGTHEWMAGKESGLAGDDAGEVLSGDMHIVYPYIVDDVGEGIVAKRRGAATIVDHLTPALGGNQLAPELQQLANLVGEWRAAGATSPERASDLASEIETAVADRGLAIDLADRGWGDIHDSNRNDRFATLEDYLAQIAHQTIPLGLHTFGATPEPDRLPRFVNKIAEANGEASREIALQRLSQTGASEYAGLLAGVSGQYVPVGPGNDPVRNLDAIPTGKNFASFDPREVPMAAADAVGRKLAEELIEKHLADHGAAPKKVALQLWGVELLRHQGVQEAQGLALLGVRPQRDARGRVTSLELIPRSDLGRPRIDVVFHATSLYRDTFPGMVELLDRAVALAASSPEEDNPIKRNAAALKQTLIEAGFSETVATQRSLIRIFAEPTGEHDSKLHAMTHASGSWDNESQVADTYIRRMGHGYGGGIWGESAEDEFRAALKDTDLILHSRASNLYATLDNDDYFSYGGSIALGVRRANGGGASPAFYVSDLRKSGAEKHEPLQRFLGQELRARYLNPEYGSEMMREGYAGARHVWQAVDYLWGWQVVYPEVVDAAKWEEMHAVWIEDRNELGLEAFFEQHNPYARQGIAARMLEVVRKGYWQPSEATTRSLLKTYIESVIRHGPSCEHLSCDNPELQRFAEQTAAHLGVVTPQQRDQFLTSIETATTTSIEVALSQRAADKTRWHRQPQTPDRVARDVASTEGDTRPVTGFELEEEVVAEAETAPAHTHLEDRQRHAFAILSVASMLACLLLGVLSRPAQSV
ncbi:cobaltochelatase subunit CobN [Hyphomicrobium sp. CS1GBMeth3]|uniref:cobaltochelatase subunit CobN n=1 Tax=Hyphomicrobium sp. CS1GBMeth3 TaxID=1892845 RepID=UPI0009308EB4|nr:cobaltochelatase subunit CobN [Hyphomicrobium sp. CS1GBMeth3]